MPLNIRQPETPEDWTEYYNLRHRVLRAPWNQPRGTEVDPQDPDCYNLMAFNEEGTVLGVGRLHIWPEDETVGQIRWMAVDNAAQGKGVGAAIIAALETRARELNAKMITLNAREIAVGFYQKLGYEQLRQTPDYVIFDAIPHYQMTKKL